MYVVGEKEIIYEDDNDFMLINPTMPLVETQEGAKKINVYWFS